MSTTETIQLVDELVKAKIPKSTATRLVDRIDRGNLEPDNPKWINLESDVQVLKNDVRWLKWAIALGFPILIGIVTYLHNNTKTEIHSVKTEMQSMQKEINAKIDQMLI